MSDTINKNFSDQLRFFVDGIIQETIHTGLPGKIIKYDGEKKKAEIELQLKKKYANGNTLMLPILYNVPVLWHGAGNAGINIPEEEFVDQSCWILFAERDIERWKYSGTVQYPNTVRKYDYSDAIAICSVNSFVESSEKSNDLSLYYNNNHVTIKESGEVEIKGSGNKITIKANGDIELGSVNIKSLLTSEFITMYNTHTHICSAPTVASGVPNALIIEAIHCTNKVKAQ